MSDEVMQGYESDVYSDVMSTKHECDKKMYNNVLQYVTEMKIGDLVRVEFVDTLYKNTSATFRKTGLDISLSPLKISYTYEAFSQMVVDKYGLIAGISYD